SVLVGELDVGDQLAAAPEGGIEGPVGVVPDQGGDVDVAGPRRVGGPGHKDAAGAVHNHRLGAVEAPSQVRDDLAFAAEGRVQRAIGVVPGQAELVTLRLDHAGDQDLARGGRLGLEGDGGGFIVGAVEVGHGAA